MDVENTESRKLHTVRQLSERFPAFSQGGIRYLIFNGARNGFESCIRRVGRKILIDEQSFLEWLDRQNGGTHAGN